jgi:GntR family transcriptional regulator
MLILVYTIFEGSVMKKVPTYLKLKEEILQRIASGELVPGQRLPSERDLAEMKGLSRMTVRQALSELVAAGALYREQGRGTFVSARKMQQRNISSFSETVRQRGFNPDTRVLGFAMGPPPEDVARRLMLPPGGETYRALRVRLADATPVAVEEVFIPLHICPGLTRDDLKGSLYRLITDKYGHRIGSVDSSVSARLASARDQKFLAVPRGTPVLRVLSLYYSTGGLTLYDERAVYRSDMYEYNIRISTPPSK